MGKRVFHPLNSIAVDMTWDHLAIDSVTSLPSTPAGKDTLLVVADEMTKFSILRCLKKKEMLGIEKVVWEVMKLFGIPKIIQSDNVREQYGRR